MKDELIDRFNDYPVEVERLLDIVEIKVHALHAGITLIKDKGKTVEISLSNKATENINGEELFKQTQPLGRAMKVGVQENAMRVTLTKSKQWLDSLKFLVKCIEVWRLKMKHKPKPKTAFNGVVILTLALVIVKILSAIYRVPYQNVLGDQGLYAYQQIYPIVALGMILSMNAIPSAVTQY